MSAGVLSVLCAYAQLSGVLPDPNIASWPVWGADFRRSHHVPSLAGPTNPAVRWFLPGGALEEPAYVGLLEFDSPIPLSAGWVPRRATIQRATTTLYSRFDGITGTPLQTVYPFWGQPTTPMFIIIPIIYFLNNNPLPAAPPGFPTEVYARVLSGGQYEMQLYSPVPADLIPLGLSPLTPPFSVVVRGIPNYRANGAAFLFTSAGGLQFTILSFANNVRRINYYFPYWRVNITVSGMQIQIQNAVGVLGNLGSLSAPGSYGVASATSDGALLLYGFHNGVVRAFDTTALDIAWQTSIAALSNNEVTTDAVDRPIAITSDDAVGIVCASNSGRIYGVNLSNGARLWEYQAGGAVMGGPSIGPDPNNSNEDTVYIVVRHSAQQSALHAIRASDGAQKWLRVLPAISRCTPTIDADGVVYLGDDRGVLYAINPDNSLRWQLSLAGPIRIAPVLANVFNPETNQIEPTLLVAASNRFLYAIVDQSVLASGSGVSRALGSNIGR
ncbi:MAG: PQQ-like beta-propeller repeat protein [Fimbriimonadales bacterium]|nr:PQQ-like beta-propeller repeat protein [Fimbriimonadales bacterium]